MNSVQVNSFFPLKTKWQFSISQMTNDNVYTYRICGRQQTLYHKNNYIAEK
uniref:Uncharacterized protein n=1 Tax=Anguilla anguilla TaxID=7936 RepID=A0A0E9XKN5_ANGAN